MHKYPKGHHTGLTSDDPKITNTDIRDRELIATLTPYKTCIRANRYTYTHAHKRNA